MKKVSINSDPFPFRLGENRVAYPGTLNGERVIHDPRPEFDGVMWLDELADSRISYYD